MHLISLYLYLLHIKGKITPESVEKGKDNSGGIGLDHLWWLMNESTKQHIAAYYSQRHNSLQELSLLQCCHIWGTNPESVGDHENGERDVYIDIVQMSSGIKISIPAVPPKYADFIRRRRRIFTEIKNMRKISNHNNVIRLEQVLELTQESKCTIFLVMELANGGKTVYCCMLYIYALMCICFCVYIIDIVNTCINDIHYCRYVL